MLTRGNTIEMIKPQGHSLSIANPVSFNIQADDLDARTVATESTINTDTWAITQSYETTSDYITTYQVGIKNNSNNGQSIAITPTLPGPTTQIGSWTVSEQLDGRFVIAVHNIHGTNDKFAPGQQVHKKYTVYIGPKDHHMPEELRSLAKYGVFKFINKPIINLFSWLTYILSSPAAALVLLILILKLITLPLANKGQMLTQKIQQLQPMISKIKEQHKANPKVAQLRVLELYKQHEINPMGALLPLLLQILLYIPMYKLFVYSSYLVQANFPLISNLAMPCDKLLYFVSPWVLAMAGSFMIQNDANGEFKYILPVMMVLVGAKFPAALVVYIALSGFLSTLNCTTFRKTYCR